MARSLVRVARVVRMLPTTDGDGLEEEVSWESARSPAWAARKSRSGNMIDARVADVVGRIARAQELAGEDGLPAP